MRWMLSRTAISGRPTRTVLGSPPETSTSTSTGMPSMPTSAKVFSLASMGRVTPAGPRLYRLLPCVPTRVLKDAGTNYDHSLDAELRPCISSGQQLKRVPFAHLHYGSMLDEVEMSAVGLDD